MPLTGTAKASYQRTYMQRRRAGLPTRKPKAKWKPTRRMIDTIERWARLRARGEPWRIDATGARVIVGLQPLDSDADLMRACRRYKALADARRAARQREAEVPTPKPRRCVFCGATTATKPRRVFAGDGLSAICSTCVAKAAAVVAKTKGRQR